MGRRKGDTRLKPPIEHQIKKGSVVPPERRKKIGETLKRVLAEKKDILYHIRELEKLDITTIENRIKDIQAGKKEGISAGEYVALKHWTGLMKGDPKALESYLNRKYGTPKQSLEISGETTQNVNLNLAQQIQQTLALSQNDEMAGEGEPPEN